MSKSEGSKRKSTEREKYTLQDLPRSQVGREKATSLIRQAEEDPHPDGKLLKVMKRLAKETKKTKQPKNDRIAIEIKLI